MLRMMFEQVDEDVIVTVLEINGGNVERTIDQLLQIQGGEPEVQSTAVGDADLSSQSSLDVHPGASGSASLSASSSASASSSSASTSDSAPSSASPSGDSQDTSSHARRRVQLPDDYLRVPGIAGSYSTPAASGQGEDEYMAQVRRGPGRREGGVAVPLSVKLASEPCTFYPHGVPYRLPLLLRC